MCTPTSTATVSVAITDFMGGTLALKGGERLWSAKIGRNCGPVNEMDAGT